MEKLKPNELGQQTPKTLVEVKKTITSKGKVIQEFVPRRKPKKGSRR